VVMGEMGMAGGMLKMGTGTSLSPRSII
jgi:hypothetical protein